MSTVSGLGIEYSVLTPEVKRCGDLEVRAVFVNRSREPIRLKTLFLSLPVIHIKIRRASDQEPVLLGPPPLPPADDGKTGRDDLAPGQAIRFDYKGSTFFGGRRLAPGEYETRFAYQNLSAKGDEWRGAIETEWKPFEVLAAAPLNVTVRLDDGFRKDARPGITPIEIHLLGVNDADVAAWQALRLARYWSDENDPMRSVPHKRTMILGAGRPSDTLTADDPLWQKWLDTGASRLVVVASLSARGESASGTDGKRRLILPLRPQCWDDDDVEILVDRDGLTLKTPYSEQTDD